MLKKRLGLVFVFALSLWGCGGGDQEVSELFDQQKEHGLHISEMAMRIDTIDETLAAIQKDLTELLAAGSVAGPGGGEEAIVRSDFASTKEYETIMQQIALLQDQLLDTRGEVIGFQEKEREISEREALRDRGAAWRAMGNPQEMSRRLGLLAQNFSGRIADPSTRTEFVEDVENLKRKYATALSPEEKREQARVIIAEAMDNPAHGEQTARRMEDQLRSLDEASGEELNERTDRLLQMQRAREIGELARQYSIPSEVVRDSGLISFDGGGPHGFMGGMRR